jgi:hypothetical protein
LKDLADVQELIRHASIPLELAQQLDDSEGIMAWARKAPSASRKRPREARLPTKAMKSERQRHAHRLAPCLAAGRVLKRAHRVGLEVRRLLVGEAVARRLR